MANLLRVVLLSTILLGGCEFFESSSDNAGLDSLTVSDGTLNPTFSRSVLRYDLSVDSSTDTLTVTATSEHGKAKVRINNQSAIRGGNSANVSLDIGENTVTVVVIAESKEKAASYVIDVFRPTPTYSIGGTVTGLNGDLTLQNNGGDDLSLNADGPFTFATEQDDGAAYDVTVSSQPTGQDCTVTNGAGILSGADVADVSVTCVDLTYSVGGQLSGLNGNVTLQNNGGDDLALTADGSFTFATELTDGTAYDVTVSSQPTGQECIVTDGDGTLNAANVTNVDVSCTTTQQLFLGGKIEGLNGVALLQINGADDLIVVKNGLFSFLKYFGNGDTYDVTVLTQPTAQTCAVTNGNGTFADQYVLDVSVVCSGAGVSSGSIFDWEWVNPLPGGSVTRAFASDGTTVVAVGEHGFVQTSTDGLTWTRRDAGISGGLVDVAWGNSQFVAVADVGTIATSPDGVTWQSSVPEFNSHSSIIWNGSLFVAGGSGFGNTTGPVIATSPDGNNWTSSLIGQPGTSGIWDIAWNGTVFAAVQYPNLAHTSSDGINWTENQVGNAGFLAAIASDGSGFVALDANGEIFSSLDGTTWVQEPNPPSNFPLKIDWDGSRFVAPGYNGYAVSTDGSTWTEYSVDSDPIALENLAASIRHGGLNIMAGGDGAMYSSPDDTSWSTPFSSALGDLRDVIWGGSQFVAVGGGPSVYTSPDGLAWTTQLSTNPASSHMLGMVFAGGQYVAVGNGTANQAMTSPDAITWTSHTVSANNLTLNNVTWGNNLYVAVGQSATIVTSPDGISWAAQTNGLVGTENLLDVEWIGGLFVITGHDFSGGFVEYFVATSSDGTSWTKQVMPQFRWIEQLAFNGSVLIGVGQNTIATSTDGMTWSYRNTNASVSEVTWSGGEFIAAGYGADILTSPDGTTWSASRTLSGFFQGMASDGTTSVFVNYQGHILRKAPPPPP